MEEENNTFLPLTNDIVFKRFFGSQDYVFLTTMLVESIFNLPRHSLDGSVISNSVKLDRKTVNSKAFELDVLLTIPNGDSYILEMQPVYNANSEIKNIMYACRVFSEGLDSGEVYKDAKNVTLVNLAKKIYLHDVKDIVNKYAIISSVNLGDQMVAGKLLFFIVDIDTENNKTYNENSNGFKLMRELLGAKTLEEAEIAIQNLNEPLLSNLLKDMVVFMGMEYVQDYSRQEKLIRSNMRDAREEAMAEGHAEGLAKGLAKGLAEGLAEGRAEEKLEIAKIMLQSNEPLEKISLFTSLSIEELKKLQENN